MDPQAWKPEIRSTHRDARAENGDRPARGIHWPAAGAKRSSNLAGQDRRPIEPTAAAAAHQGRSYTAETVVGGQGAQACPGERFTEGRGGRGRNTNKLKQAGDALLQ